MEAAAAAAAEIGTTNTTNTTTNSSSSSSIPAASSTTAINLTSPKPVIGRASVEDGPMQTIVVPLDEASPMVSKGCEVDAILLTWLILLDRYNTGSEVSFVWGPSRPDAVRMSTADVSLAGTDPISKVIERLHALRLSLCPAVGDGTSGDSQKYLYVSPEGGCQDGTTQHPMTGFQANITPESISISFPQPVLQLQVSAFQDILATLLSTDLRQPLSSVLLPTKSDMKEIWTWNYNLPPTVPRCMHELISDVAAASPDAPAVHAWDGDLTYRQLDALSDALARRLLSHGVGTGPSALVPLCFEKSVHAVVSVLAVMKAGAGFVFLSPTQPVERLRTIVTEVGSGSVVVCSEKQARLAKDVAPDARHHLVVSHAMLEDSNSVESSPPSPLPSADPEGLLYVIFTSGSTGKPKGVAISHSNYTSGAVPRAEAVGYKSTSRVLDFAAYVFDVSIDCMLCTLACGGCICIPSEEDRVNSLSSVIKKLDVNMAHMTPSVARVLEPEVMGSLDVLGLGGEAVSAKDAAVWSQKTKVVVAYGPSECTVGCTINNDIGRDATTPYASIGKGVGGATWIVDPEDHNRLVPLGAVGELLVEGPIVGQGYLNRPDLTEQVFVKDPSWLVAGHDDIPGRRGRLYKTGDLVSYALDGSGRINFVARKDQQVKIRGQRVELAEIEHHLRENLPHRAGVAAEVITPGGVGAEPMLVAFIAEDESQQDPRKDHGELLRVSFSTDFDEALVEANSILSTKLPIYMVPSAYIPLAKIPTLVSCKTDRKHLREIGASMSRPQLAKLRASPVSSSSETHPETRKEKLLSKLWSQVIGANVDAGKSDSFFYMGGDSLKAMRLVAAARKEGMKLTVGDVFSNPCLSSMANVAALSEGNTDLETIEPKPFSLLPSCWDAVDLKTAAAKLCKLNVDEIEDIYPCTPLQEGLMALSAKIRDAYVAQRVVRLKDASVASRLQEAFAMTSADSPILRTRIVQVPFKGLLQVTTRGDIPWRTGANGLKQYLEDDRADPMELGTALVRYAVITDPKTGGIDFVLTIHHALYDGWSMQLLVERVNRAYQGLRLPRPTSFKSFIGYLGSCDRETSEMYWREYLRGADGPQFPPHPYKGYQTKADSLLERYITLPPSSAKAKGATGGGTTLATAIRAAWALTAAKELGIEDVILGETLTGRNAPIPGVEGIEGPMITTIPVRVNVVDDMPKAEFLREIHEQTISRIPHENLGLQNIRRLGPDAREACELKTGLVLHPAEDQNEESGSRPENEPANGFVPADDAEAAREALKFNTYALMLVCSLDPKGFLVMASFDSHTLEMGHMERLLRHMDRVVTAFYQDDGGKLGDIDVVDDEDIEQVWTVSSAVEFSDEANEKCGLPRGTTVSSAWVVSPHDVDKLLPVGAVGEVVIECLQVLPLQRMSAPKWLAAGHGQQFPGRRVQLYITGQVGKYNQDGQITIVESIAAWVSKKGRRKENPPEGTQGVSSIPTKREKMLPSNSTFRRQLLQLWSRAVYLPEEEIDPADSFFALGGDSIGAMKLVSEARHLGFELSVADIFKHKTLVALEKVARKIPSTTVVTATAAATRPETPENPPKMTDSGYGSPAATQSSPTSTSSLSSPVELSATAAKPFGTLMSGILHHIVRPQLRCGSKAEIVDVIPTRPLQDIAILGTVQNPKFSVRYEMFHFPASVDQERIRSACKELVRRNEILRTVFVSSNGLGQAATTGHLAVVLSNLNVPFESYELSSRGDAVAFSRAWSQLDVQTTQPLGSSFVKFMLVSTPEKKATLVFRISHAQYDEIALPGLLYQLASLYSGFRSSTVPSGVPFSEFVAHTTARMQAGDSMKYWRKLLDGAEWSSLSWPDKPVGKEGRMHYAVEKSFPITTRPEGVTLATLPTAAWALLLARMTKRTDIMFGEVVSGRSPMMGLEEAGKVVGPAWQYVPVRVRFGKGVTTGVELLEEIQRQHVEGAAHECVSLREMVREGVVEGWFPPWDELEDGEDSGSQKDMEPWFPTVVHQAVVATGSLEFGGGEKGADGSSIISAEMETLYPQQEPLREWKVQAFVEDGGKKMTLEIVTFDGWKKYADEILVKLGEVFEALLERPGEAVWE